MSAASVTRDPTSNAVAQLHSTATLHPPNERASERKNERWIEPTRREGTEGTDDQSNEQYRRLCNLFSSLATRPCRPPSLPSPPPLAPPTANFTPSRVRTYTAATTVDEDDAWADSGGSALPPSATIQQKAAAAQARRQAQVAEAEAEAAEYSRVQALASSKVRWSSTADMPECFKRHAPPQANSIAHHRWPVRVGAAGAARHLEAKAPAEGGGADQCHGAIPRTTPLTTMGISPAATATTNNSPTRHSPRQLTPTNAPTSLFCQSPDRLELLSILDESGVQLPNKVRAWGVRVVVRPKLGPRQRRACMFTKRPSNMASTSSSVRDP